MGPLETSTKHYILKVENETKAKNVLDLYLRNRDAFEKFEPTRPMNFYTIDYHTALLSRERKAYQDGTFIRYYIYSPSNTNRIIGAVNFNLYFRASISYAEIGYKVDSLYQNQGVAYEVLSHLIPLISRAYDIHAFHARIHPENYSSIRLATKLGFQVGRMEPKSANILGKDEDIVRYCLITSQTQ